MAEQEMPNPGHPAWQMVCPFSQMTHATCNVGDTDEGMSPEHIQWHMNRLVDIGEMQIVGGADDNESVQYRLTDPESK